MNPLIPSSFQVSYRKIRVVVDKKLGRCDGASGEARHNEGLIVLDTHDGLPDEEVESVFWHEVWHHMMSVQGEDALKDNEQLADSFGGLMAQMMRSAKWGRLGKRHG